MSKLENLIAELCPNGVEYKRIEECCTLLDSKRKPVTKKDRNKGIYPYYGANGIQDYVDNYIFDGIFLLVGEDGSVINKDNSPVLTWAEGKIWVNNHAHILTEKTGYKLRYLYFCLQTIDISSVVRGTPPKLNQQNLNNIIIPIPPLQVQEEIVRILDTFTELTAELTKRKQQYQYYKNFVFNFDSNIDFEALGKLCKIGDGLHGTPIYNDNGEYYFINGNNLSNGKIIFNRNTKKVCFSEFKKYNNDLDTNTLLLSINGTIGNVAFFNNEKIILGKSCSYIKVISSKILKQYLFYILQTKKSLDYFEVNKTGSTIKNLGLYALRKMQIPVPPLEEQHRIVSILDRFDTLCNDLTSGLPAEIEARKKQYEYYRDKLLSFKELEQ